MSPFEHVSVLISIILGLGITRILSSAHQLVQGHDHIRFYWLPLAWAALVFTAQVEWWWASFEFREQLAWNFFYFLFVLLSPIMLYLAAAFVLPEIDAEETCDLESYYYNTRGWLFSFLALGTALDAVRRGIQADAVASVGVLSNVVATILVGSLAVSRNERYHGLITVLVTTLFLFFIVMSALELG